MAAWSPEIAGEFVRLALDDGRLLDQLQLQELVYIAHGWCLAETGQPLTGDRPEALPHGPEYRRLARLLAAVGAEAVTLKALADATCCDCSTYRFELDQSDRDWVERIYKEYGDLEANRLAALTRREHTPWAAVFAQGEGASKEISHAMIRAQFVELSQRFSQ